MLRIVHRLEEWLIAALMGAMTLLTFTQVVLRYVFNSGLIWALEATTYLFGWLVLLGMSYGVRVNAHIGVDMIVKLLPPSSRRVVGVIGVALCLLYAALMAWGSWVYIDKMMQLGIEGEDIAAPRWLLSVILPIGFGLLFIRLLPVALGILRGRRALLADEAETTIQASTHLQGDGDATEATRR